MNNVRELGSNEVHFGFNLDPEANSYLQRAAVNISSRKEALQDLLRAHKSLPDQLDILVAMYKFYFYEGDLSKAEDTVFQALIKSSMRGGFSYHWNRVTPQSANWEDPRGPGRIYLYSLKALAFIHLRQNSPDQAHDILEHLNRIDPRDLVGASVIHELLEAIDEDSHDD